MAGRGGGDGQKGATITMKKAPAQGPGLEGLYLSGGG